MAFPTRTDPARNIDRFYIVEIMPSLFGDWTVLGGLRLEDVQLDLNQITTHLAHSSDAVGAYPSLHVGYKVAAKMGDNYLKMLDACEVSIA